MTQDSALSRAAARPTRRGSPGVKNWESEGEGKLSKRGLGRTENTGGGMCAKTIEGWGGGTEERKGSRQYSVGTEQAAGRQLEEKKGGMGERERERD